MLSLPFLPQLKRSFRLFIQSRVFSMNASFMMFQPTENEGNTPYLKLEPKRLEPSRRTVAWNM